MGEVGFEPTLPEREEVLKTYALDHSATHPKTLVQILIFHMYNCSCNTQNFRHRAEEHHPPGNNKYPCCTQLHR